jgi:hypothetical protein
MSRSEEEPEPDTRMETNGRATAPQRGWRNPSRMTPPTTHKPNAEDPHHA